MKITETIDFEENVFLSKQTTEFQEWYNDNVNVLINDTLAPDLFDIFKRPMSYTVTVGTFTITIEPKYIYSDQSNWACSDFNITIKSV